jgi:regulatory protein
MATQGTITLLEVQKRNKNRVNVHLDGEYAFSLTLDEAARLHKGQVLSEADVERLHNDDDVIRAVDASARFLATRPRSEHEVRDNLVKKETDPTVIDAAVERLRALGYLDDLAFAQYWVQNRTTFKPLSARALRYELRQKGVANPIIDQVLADLDGDSAAYSAAQEHLRKLRGLTRREFSEKLTAFLQRRGFSFGEIRPVIQQVLEELDETEPDRFTEADEAQDDDDSPKGGFKKRW